ncbi:hypothetical protein PF005_g8197 [Phytophthora fragariae]|uniref:Uncharacterized protein n=2 Tax=Phytophthora TaxID=4783 RepID=A0A6A3YGJ8_9STRA|nr:hypothetical protein PF003_g7026 [Phytophthora fragariae]KAE9037977.1 hypothetical protein PR002_g6273 [Phytophthora rubi]KAE8941095.1 hypothetical protein PF009_g9121 [Phytophthora fragariae]KAE9016441.1 hypothetical protein PF011_g7147 [Phytophthora fragariae]KAE9051281.1 hypothetical protein PR001_g1597 [Phytophthora rubi]
MGHRLSAGAAAASSARVCALLGVSPSPSADQLAATGSQGPRRASLIRSLAVSSSGLIHLPCSDIRTVPSIFTHRQ